MMSCGDNFKFDDSQLQPVHKDIIIKVAKWIYAEDVLVYTQPEMESLILQSAFQSPYFVRAYYEARNRSPLGDVVIPIVRQKDSNQVVACGRPCDWQEGVAVQVLAGQLAVGVVVFRVPKRDESDVRQQENISSPQIQALTVTSATAGNLVLEPKSSPGASANKERISLTSSISHGCYMTKGNRRHMEDEHFAELDMELLAYRIRNSDSLEGFKRKYPNHTYFVILDGHNGREAVEFVRDTLHRQIVQSHHFPLNLNVAIRESFHYVDQKLLETSAIEKWESGTTAISLILSGDRILIGHAGDCRAIISRGGKAVTLTIDHSPNHPEERKRVERTGGFVRDGRVANLLSVARALGDFDVEAGKKLPGLSCEPDIIDHLLQDSDEFIILATDGLWEKFQDQNAVSFARRSLQRHQDVQRTCEELVTEALRRQTTDNVAVLIVSFHNRQGFSWENSHTDKVAEKIPVTAERRSSKGGIEFKSRPRFCFKGLKILQDALQDANDAK